MNIVIRLHSVTRSLDVIIEEIIGTYVELKKQKIVVGQHKWEVYKSIIIVL